MPRLVLHTAIGPAKVTIGDKVIGICRCGLTKNQDGLCDGSHHKTEDEDAQSVYHYEEDYTREKIGTMGGGCACGEGGCGDGSCGEGGCSREGGCCGGSGAVDCCKNKGHKETH